jgi:hypothetical protein
MADLMAEWPHLGWPGVGGVFPPAGPQFNTERRVLDLSKTLGTKIRTSDCPTWWHRAVETVKLTLEPAGTYRGRRRWTVREVPEVSATVNPILDAVRWHLCQGHDAWTQYKVFIAGDRRIMAYGLLGRTACLNAYMLDYPRPKSETWAAAYEKARWAAKIGMETRKLLKEAGLPCESRPRTPAETKRYLQDQRERNDREALYEEGDKTALSPEETEEYETRNSEYEDFQQEIWKADHVYRGRYES